MASARSLLVAFLSVVVLVEGGVVRDPPENKIVGGENIEISGAPFQVYLKVGDFQCGGSIISSRWILSAAHCTYEVPLSDIEVLVGTKSLESGGTKYKVQKVVNHENYDNNRLLNDISLVQTTDDMNLGVVVKKVRLPQLGAQRPTKGTKLRVSGWGWMENDKTTTLLRAVDVYVKDYKECFINEPSDEATQICAGQQGKNSCRGDSGGPLVKDDDLQVGIVSYKARGLPCGSLPHVYTDVAAYRQWIQKHANV